MASNPSPAPAEVVGKIAVKIAGALSGTVYVDSLESSIASLKAEVARLLGVADDDATPSIKLILAGKTLQDADTLRSCGVSASSRVLVTRGAAAGAQLNSESQKRQRLEQVRRVVEGLAGMHGRGRYEEGYEMSLENQAGSSVRYKAEDQRALVMGLTMHERGKTSMGEERFAAALDELMLAEECFNMCDPSLTSGIDNVGMLLLDIVWCAYKLGDARRLAVCRDRLTKARESLLRAYGPQLQRAALLQGGELCPALATFARLEAMEGVVAYYGQDMAAAAASLAAAGEKVSRLQVSEQRLGELQGLGYSAKEARRGLRFGGGEVSAAVGFIAAQRAQREERRVRRRRQAAWAQERGRYGQTPGGAYVEVEPLDALCGMGYDKALAAEALRRQENNSTLALEALLDPRQRAALGLAAALAAAAAAAAEGPGGSAAGAGSEQAVAMAKALAESMHSALGAAAAGAAGSDEAMEGEEGEGGEEGEEEDRGEEGGEGTGGAGEGSKKARKGGSKRSKEAVEGAAGEGSAAASAAAAAAAAAASAAAAAAAAAALIRRSESDEELEGQILAGVKREQDPMDAYDAELEEAAKIISTFQDLVKSHITQQQA